MDLPWGDKRNEKFATGVGLITTDGPHGPNIISVEGTHLLSYQPGLISVNIGNGKPSYDNIRATKHFGVNIAAVDQAKAVLISGRNSGKTVDKIAALKAIGFKFTKGTHVLMLDGAALHAECKVIGEHKVGDHTIFIGEVLSAKESDKQPIAYRQGQLYTMVPMPWPEIPADLIAKHTKGVK